MSTVSCFCNCCPSAVQTINVTQQSLTMDGVAANFYQQMFRLADFQTSGGVYFLTLDHFPFDPQSVTLYLNGVAQRPDVASNPLTVNKDYYVTGKTITLGFVPADTDVFLATYFAYEASSWSSDLIPVGTQVAYGGSVIPPGWCLMDGVTALAKASYPALYVFAKAAGLVLAGSDAGTTFILVELSAEEVDVDDHLVDTPYIIKA